MVFNPYAKKRPRPSEWTAENTVNSNNNDNLNDGSVVVASAVRDARTTVQSTASPNPYLKKSTSNVTHASAKSITTSQSSTLLASSPNPYLKPKANKSPSPNNPYLKRPPAVGAVTVPPTGANPQKSTHPQLYQSNGSSTFIQRPTNKYNTAQATVASSSARPPVPRPPAISVATTAAMSNTAATSKAPSAAANMASMRPSSWNSGIINDSIISSKSTSLPPSPNVQHRTTSHVESTTTSTTTRPDVPHLPGEIPLPRELWYDPTKVKPVHDEYKLTLIQNAQVSQPLLNGWTLYPHQRKAIIRALQMRRMILALDMGLGKTLIGCVWAKAFERTFGSGGNHNKNTFKTIVVAPVSLIDDWKETAKESVGLQLEGDNVANKKIGIRICSWAKVPVMVEKHIEKFVVVCDEAHSMQSMNATRTKDVLTLASDKRCVGLLLLTGTPMKNGKASNLFPLLKAVRHPLGRHQNAYELHYCEGKLMNFGRGGPKWVANGCSNLEQLQRLVRPCLLYMTKEDCLKDLQPMENVFHDIPVSRTFQNEYSQAILVLAKTHANATSGKKNNVTEEAVLGAMQKLRMVCARSKVDAAVELARSVLEEEPAVVIFTSFATVAKSVHAQLNSSGWPAELLTGDTPQKKRKGLVDKFQKGLTSVFVCTFGAGGVGLTLTAAHTIILLDRPWTPGETRQAEDRIRRIGQTKKCKSYWMRSFELDKQIDGMLESKTQSTNVVLNRVGASGGPRGNSNATALSAPSAKISITKLVQSFVLSEAAKTTSSSLRTSLKMQ